MLTIECSINRLLQFIGPEIAVIQFVVVVDIFDENARPGRDRKTDVIAWLIRHDTQYTIPDDIGLLNLSDTGFDVRFVIDILNIYCKFIHKPVNGMVVILCIQTPLIPVQRLMGCLRIWVLVLIQFVVDNEGYWHKPVSICP